MKGAVERRPHQLGHAGVDDREVAVRAAGLQIGDPGDERARRAGDGASRLDDDRQLRRAHLLDQRRHILLDRRHPPPSYEMPRPPPRSTYSSGKPSAWSSRRQVGRERRRAAQRIDAT